MARKRGNSEGTIRQRKDGTWEARITVAVTRDGTAKQRSFYGKTRAEVAAKLREAQEKLASGTLVDPNRLSVSDWLERWLNGKRNVTNATLASYRKTTTILSRHIGLESGRNSKFHAWAEELFEQTPGRFGVTSQHGLGGIVVEELR